MLAAKNVTSSDVTFSIVDGLTYDAIKAVIAYDKDVAIRGW